MIGRSIDRSINYSNPIEGLLSRAEECGVSDCVKAAIPQAVQDDASAAKTAMCKARQSCQPAFD